MARRNRLLCPGLRVLVPQSDRSETGACEGRMNDTKATVGPRGAGTSLVQRVRTAPIRRCHRTPAVAPPAEQLSGTFLADSLAGAAKEWANRRIVPGFGASLAPPSAIAEVWARLLPAERGGRPLAAAAAASVATAGPPRRLSPAEGEPRAPGSWPRRLWRMLASIRPHCFPQAPCSESRACVAARTSTTLRTAARSRTSHRWES
mmetsp:Transcript_69/g.207  ORF Transcript_69/g.207 Transcript_69/m.207 type:complete len:205 (+) Transcript_69:1175-1789(+)